MRFKIMRFYSLEAKTREEALEKFALAVKANTEDDYFESEVMKRVYDEDTGWISTLKRQVTGK